MGEHPSEGQPVREQHGMEGPIGKFDGAQGEVVLVRRREETKHVPDHRNQDDHQPQCRTGVVDDWEWSGTIPV